MTLLLYILVAYQVFMLLYFIALNSGYTFVTFFAYRHIKNVAETAPDLDQLLTLTSMSNLRPISIVVPAFNEELNICNTIIAATRITYPEYEILVVNDGSTDATMSKLIERFELVEIDRPAKTTIPTEVVHKVYVSRLYPDLWVIDKENGGKADALNVGMSYSRFPLFCAVDADSLLEPDALLRMGQQFLLNKELVAAGGAVRVLNGCDVENSTVVNVRAPSNILAIIQIAEYLRGFLAGRIAWGEYNSLLIISGAFGVFRKDLLLAIDGYRKTVGEDMDLVLRLHRHCIDNEIKYKVSFASDPVCWTQVPSDLMTLLRQRNRWQRGLFDSLWYNRAMLFNPRYGKIGTIGLPCYLIFELLGPVIEFFGYFAFLVFFYFHLLNPIFVTLFLVTSILWGMWLNAAAVLLDNHTICKYDRVRDVYKVALLGSLDYLGYRQLLAVERFIGTFQVWRSHWGEMKRKPIDQGENIARPT